MVANYQRGRDQGRVKRCSYARRKVAALTFATESSGRMSESGLGCAKTKTDFALMPSKNIPEKQRQRIRMVLLREEGLAQPAIGSAMGVSLSTVNRAHMAYDQGGIKALKPKPCGGRQRQNMTIAEEKTLLARFANAAGAGELLNIHDLKHAYEQAIGHATSNSTVYDLLARHGWRKLMPRPFHPKRDVAAQDAFKKTAFLAL
jgi:transposase